MRARAARPSAVGLGILESVVHESTGAASLVNLVAVNELLLGEELEGAGGDVDVALTQMKLQETCCPQ